MLAALVLILSANFNFAVLVHVEPVYDFTATTSIAQYVRHVQYANDLGDDFYRTLECESHFQWDAVGDRGRSFGVAQIFLPAHLDITKEQALDAQFAVDWTAAQFKKGKQRMWTCWRLLSKAQPTPSL